MEKVHNGKNELYVSKLIFYSKLCASDKHAWNSTQNDDPKTPEEFTITLVFGEAQTFWNKVLNFRHYTFQPKRKRKALTQSRAGPNIRIAQIVHINFQLQICTK